MTRLLRAHPEISVEFDDGRLVVAWSGRREQVEVCNRWRVEESWWREPISRDYFKVVCQHWLETPSAITSWAVTGRVRGSAGVWRFAPLAVA